MATYVIVNIIFIAIVLLLLRERPGRPSRASLITLAILLALTAVFDSIIVGLSIVGYDASKIIGLYIGNAPIEDFFYAVLAVIVVPTLWQKIWYTHARKN
jgi:lycopene cyclase domain-containing protein